MIIANCRGCIGFSTAWWKSRRLEKTLDDVFSSYNLPFVWIKQKLFVLCSLGEICNMTVILRTSPNVESTNYPNMNHIKK